MCNFVDPEVNGDFSSLVSRDRASAILVLLYVGNYKLRLWRWSDN
jgi:hypothetical protein